MAEAMGDSSRTRSFWASHQAKKFSTTGRDFLWRTDSFLFLGESAMVRSMRKSAPMKASACLARSGSDSRDLKK